MPETTTLTQIQFANLPALGAPLAGGIFIGVITQPDGTHAAVALLPDRAEDVTWQAATEWAEKLGGQLPTRPMAAMIFANTQERPKSGWHWTCETHKDDASYAWHCHFLLGNQHGTHKSYEGAAVAVRLIPLTA